MHQKYQIINKRKANFLSFNKIKSVGMSNNHKIIYTNYINQTYDSKHLRQPNLKLQFEIEIILNATYKFFHCNSSHNILCEIFKKINY